MRDSAADVPAFCCAGNGVDDRFCVRHLQQFRANRQSNRTSGVLLRGGMRYLLRPHGGCLAGRCGNGDAARLRAWHATAD
jgi:hypothetical protein